MGVSRRRFASAFLGSLVLTSVMVGAISTGGVAVAVPMGGVGGFTVTFDQLQGTGMELYPTVANTSECEKYPSLVTTVDEGTITNLKLYKDMEVPGTGDTMRVVMASDDVSYTGLKQRFTYLNGDHKFKSGQTITQNPSGDIENQFSLSADRIVIEDAQINAQSQFVRTITLRDLEVYVKLNPKDSADLRNTKCAKKA